MKKWFMTLALCLLVPAGAMAVTEGVVENAPPVEMIEVGRAEVSYLPDSSYYAGYGDWNPAWENAEGWVESGFDGECYHDVEQRPRMTAGEAARAKALLEAYQKGEAAYTGESILNQMENVVVGVYALQPDDYHGEQTYVILPGPCMTDEQILAVIDAHAQLGLVFDPEALNYMNCTRGGGVETSRFLTEEEGERYRSIARLIERGLLDTSGVSAMPVLRVKLDSRYFCGLPDFSIRPYRRQTDEELAAALLEMGVRDLSAETDFGGIEARSRAVLNNRLAAPLSMNMEHVYTEGSYVPGVFDAVGNQGYAGEGRRAYGADFTYRTPSEILVYGHTMFDDETDELISASVMHDHPDNYGVWPEPGREITQEEIAAATKDVEKRLGLENLSWHVGEMTWTNWGECLCVRAKISQNEWMTIYLSTEDGLEHGLQIERGDTVDRLPEDDVPVNG